jgi:FdhE protein
MNRSDVRIARARELAREHAASSEILSFYADLMRAQQTLLQRSAPPALGLDFDAVADLVPEFLLWLRRAAPDHLAQAAANLLRDSETDWRRLIDSYWNTPGHDLNTLDDVRLFVIEAVLQPFAEAFASTSDTASAMSQCCPVCNGRPVVSTLRERGHGGRRGLVCGLCLTEFAWLRMQCPACDESRFDALPVYRAETLAGVRVDACETCKTYIKTIDLTENGSAVPVVDDLATISLDLWAQQQGYRKLRPNVLRI